MNKLPAEILIPIFSHLQKTDHLQCVHVCKQWHEIISNGFLYKTLKFKIADNVYKAIDLFDRKRKFGELVEDLTIEDCRLDIYSIISMPRQIPNLKVLNWSEPARPAAQRRRIEDSQEIPNKLVYRRELSKWKSIEKIKADVERLPFVSMLLESTTLVNLTSLDISFFSLALDGFFDEEALEKIRSYVKLIMHNIKSAPSLKEIKLLHPVLDLDDMEKLHAGAPKLRKIDFGGVVLAGGAQNNMVINADGMRYSDGGKVAHEAANTVTHLIVTFLVDANPESVHNVTGIAKDVMLNWLSYISLKYNNIIFLVLKGHGSNYLPRIPEFEQPTVKIISKLTKIKNYHAFLYPVTKAITDAFDRNDNGTLKNLYIYTGSLDEIDNQLNFVNTSKQAKTIEFLRIDAQGVDVTACQSFNNVLSGLAQNFVALQSLTLRLNIHYSAIVELLQQLPELTTLNMYSIKFELGESMALVPITKCKLQNLSADLNCDKRTTMYQLNQTMDFLIQSCPHLVTFRVGGSLPFIKGILRLCFFDHPELKSVFVKIQGIQYYSFPWVNGKQGLEWASFSKEVDVKDTTGIKLHAEIAWRSNKTVKLELAKAPVNKS